MKLRWHLMTTVVMFGFGWHPAIEQWVVAFGPLRWTIQPSPRRTVTIWRVTTLRTGRFATRLIGARP